MQNFGIWTPFRLFLNGPTITNLVGHFAKITLKLDEKILTPPFFTFCEERSSLPCYQTMGVLNSPASSEYS